MAEALAVVEAISAIVDLISVGYRLASVTIDLKDSTSELQVNAERTAIVGDLESTLGSVHPLHKARSTVFQSL